MSFHIAYKSLLTLEGLHSNDPRDAGGETFLGVARNKHPNWPGWPLFDKVVKEGTSAWYRNKYSEWVVSTVIVM